MAKDNSNISAGASAAKNSFTSSYSGGSSGSGFNLQGLGPVFGAAGDLVSGLGSAFSSFEAMQGAQAEGGTYRQAEGLARQNIELEQQSVAIQREQQNRNEVMTMGSQRAAVGANGFSQESGSALDLLSASRSQGALAKSLVSLNGSIKELGYEQQATAYEAQAKAADTAAKGAEGGIFGGIMKGVMAVAPLLLL